MKNAFEEAFKKHHLRSAVIRQTPVALYATDLEGVVLFSEGGVLARLGLQEGQIVGLSMKDFDGYPQWKAARDRLVNGEDSVSYIVHHDDPTKPHAGVWAELFSPLRGPSGRIKGVVVLTISLRGAEPYGDCPYGECLAEDGG